MSFHLTIPRNCKLGVWWEQENGPRNYGAQILPLANGGVEVAVTNGHSAAFVKCSGTGDAPQFINPQALVVSTGETNVKVESKEAALVQKTYHTKDGVRADAIADYHRNVDIMGVIPDMTGSPLASIEIDPKMLLEICKAIGHKEGAVRLTFAIQQVPFIQYGMAQFSELNRPDLHDLVSDLDSMIANEGVVLGSLRWFGLIFDSNQWVPDWSTSTRTSDAYIHSYWVRVDPEVTDTTQIAEMLLAEYDTRQMDRHLAVPKERTSCLVTSSTTNNFGCLMPNNSHRDVRSCSHAVRLITDQIEALKSGRRLW